MKTVTADCIEIYAVNWESIVRNVCGELAVVFLFPSRADKSYLRDGLKDAAVIITSLCGAIDLWGEQKLCLPGDSGQEKECEVGRSR